MHGCSALGKSGPGLTSLFIVNGLKIGGAETMLLRLLSQMDRRKFSNIVISLQDIGPIGQRVRELGIPVYGLGWKSAFPSPMAVVSLARTVRMLNPDVIQGWMTHGNIAAEVARITCGRRVPVVWNVHHSLNEFGLVGEVRSCRRSTALLVRLLKHISSWPAEIVYVSRASAEQHKQFGYDARRAIVIPNGFDCETFRPRPECRKSVRASVGLAEHVPLIGLVARVHPVKDHDTFLRGAQALVSRGLPAQFVIVGKGTCSKDMAAQIAALGLDGRVHALGERSDLPELTAALDLATCSSRSEAFPIVIGEAMACGVPCVVTDVGDSAWLVGETGRVVPAGDPFALGRAWQGMLELTPERRRELGEAARARIIRHFSMEQIVSQYEQLYLELVHGRQLQLQ